MADTIKQKILDNIVAALATIPELTGGAIANAPDILDLETAVLPKAFVDSSTQEENLDEHDTESEAWVWRPIISVYFRVSNPDDNREPEKWLGLIHAKLCTDRSRGGYADETARLDDNVLDLDAQGGLVQGLMMIWEIKYTHTKNDPYTQYG